MSKTSDFKSFKRPLWFSPTLQVNVINVNVYIYTDKIPYLSTQRVLHEISFGGKDSTALTD